MIDGITDHIDLAQLLLAAFGAFFAGLVFYLRREDKREGYPLEDARPGGRRRYIGFPAPPAPKTYSLLGGGTVTLPQSYDAPPLQVRPRHLFPGAPLYPIGEALEAGIGPGAYTLRRDTPFLMLDGLPQVAPLRVATTFLCVDQEIDPRGMRVFGSDNTFVGTVHDLWVDKGVKILRYLEVALDGGAGHRLVPIFYTEIVGKARFLRVECIKAVQFSAAPTLHDPDQITAREEDRINGYYAGGALYSVPISEVLR